jgi:hypothetical protein
MAIPSFSISSSFFSLCVGSGFVSIYQLTGMGTEPFYDSNERGLSLGFFKYSILGLEVHMYLGDWWDIVNIVGFPQTLSETFPKKTATT